jgi:hypothetical protein
VDGHPQCLVILLTVGRDRDPAEFGAPEPANVLLAWINWTTRAR